MADEVVVAANGAAYVAPTATAAPTNVSSSLAAWSPLGYVSEDGATLLDSREDEHVVRLSNASRVRDITSKRAFLASFTLREWNKRAALLAFGGTVSISGSEWKYVPPLKTFVPDDRSLVLDWSDGAKKYRLYIPRGAVVSTEEVILSRTQPAELKIEFAALTETPYIIFTNDPAFFTALVVVQSVDAIIRKSGLTKVQSVDALVYQTKTKTQSVDAVIYRPSDYTPPARRPGPKLRGARMGPPILVRQTWSDHTQPPVTRSQSVDALITAFDVSKTQSVDALVKSSLTQVQSVDALISAPTGVSQSIDTIVGTGWGTNWGLSPWGGTFDAYSDTYGDVYGVAIPTRNRSQSIDALITTSTQLPTMRPKSATQVPSPKGGPPILRRQDDTAIEEPMGAWVLGENDVIGDIVIG